MHHPCMKECTDDSTRAHIIRVLPSLCGGSGVFIPHAIASWLTPNRHAGAKASYELEALIRRPSDRGRLTGQMAATMRRSWSMCLA